MRTRLISTWDVLVFLLSLCVFLTVVLGDMRSDIPSDILGHALYIQKMVQGEVLPPANFLYFGLVYVVSLFDTREFPLLLASALVLSLAVSAKFAITRTYASNYLANILGGAQASERAVILVSVMLLIAFSMPMRRLYLGQIPPSVWHNSTIVFVMPLALLLFWQSYEQLMEPNRRRVFVLSILCVANIFAKPSYVFVFCVAYPCMLFIRFRLSSTFWWNLPPILIGAGLVVGQFVLIYFFSLNSFNSGESGVSIAPFLVWSHFSSFIPLSVVASFLFPLGYLSIYWRDLANQTLVQYSVIGCAVALGIFVTFAETGPRQWHGNFAWQAIISSYILFMVLALRLLAKITAFGMRDARNAFIALLFCAHVGAGVYYLYAFLSTGLYL